ncbi:hypothetical protein [Azospirillum brasilense]|uniref:hypothetical protein n=1 Tax=Azospirillum brasilense TaxID=192 RepID=UPI0010BFD0EE|nr:hypothetical protein [Azospirillum brasilense]
MNRPLAFFSVLAMVALSGCDESIRSVVGEASSSNILFNSYEMVLKNKAGVNAKLISLSVSREWEKEGDRRKLETANYFKGIIGGRHSRENAVFRIVPKIDGVSNFQDFFKFQAGAMKEFCVTEPLFFVDNNSGKFPAYMTADWSEYCQISRGGTSEFLIGRVFDIDTAFAFVYILDTTRASDVLQNVPLDALKGWLEDGRSKLDAFRVMALSIEDAKKP